MTTSTPIHPRRALRTTDAARYLGISPSLLRKMRSRGPADPLGAGPPYIRLSPSLIVYEISVLDAWLDAHSLHAGSAA
jgi:predicted DNA-binding transcriptional regulator AlpA